MLAPETVIAAISRADAIKYTFQVTTEDLPPDWRIIDRGSWFSRLETTPVLIIERDNTERALMLLEGRPFRLEYANASAQIREDGLRNPRLTFYFKRGRPILSKLVKAQSEVFARLCEKQQYRTLIYLNSNNGVGFFSQILKPPNES